MPNRQFSESKLAVCALFCINNNRKCPFGGVSSVIFRQHELSEQANLKTCTKSKPGRSAQAETANSYIPKQGRGDPTLVYNGQNS